MRTTVAAVALGALVAGACGATGGPSSSRGDGSSASDVAASGACPEGTLLHGGDGAVESSAGDPDAQFPWLRTDPVAAEGFDRDEIISGGPPPDGIEPIEQPCFEPVEAAGDRLEPQSPVLDVQLDGDRRAYPLAIMTQHEIVNDVIAGQPVVVTYCPLCNSGLAFHREVDGEVLDFGTSGRLFRSNLVMYDRQYKNLWVQFTGRAVVGERWAGTELERIPTALVSFEEFREAAPDGLVLAPETNPDRDYGRNPYPGYESRASDFLFDGPTDDRLPPNTRVAGLTGPHEQDPIAVPLERLRDERVVQLELGGAPIVLWWAPGAASAVDANTVAGGRDVGQTSAFRRDGAHGSALTFQEAPDVDDRFVDEQTGSTWTFDGRAVEGPLEGTQLERVAVDDTFWFVWFAFRPTTTVSGGDAS